MADYSPEIKAVLDTLLAQDSRIRSGKMFGYPAYFVGKKLCICLYESGIGIKLPAATVARLLAEDPHASPFQPMGRRTMKEWVRVDLLSPQDYLHYDSLLDESIRYVSGGNP